MAWVHFFGHVLANTLLSITRMLTKHSYLFISLEMEFCLWIPSQFPMSLKTLENPFVLIKRELPAVNEFFCIRTFFSAIRLKRSGNICFVSAIQQRIGMDKSIYSLSTPNGCLPYLLVTTIQLSSLTGYLDRGLQFFSLKKKFFKKQEMTDHFISK